jgi:hypothetical protein
VEVVRESNFGEILGVDNPQVQEGAEQLGIGVEKAHELLGSVTSAYVRALK